MRTIPAAGKEESCLGPVFSTIYKFGSIQFSDMLMSDGYFRIFGQNKVSKGAKIRNRYNQVPHLTQDTNEKVTNSQSDTTNEGQEVSPFPAGDHKAQINRRALMYSKHKTEKKPIKDPQKKYRLGTVSKIFH